MKKSIFLLFIVLAVTAGFGQAYLGGGSTVITYPNSSGGNSSGGGSATITNGTANTAVITDASTNLTSSPVTATELGYVAGTTGPIQTNIDARVYGVTTMSNLCLVDPSIFSNMVAVQGLATTTDGQGGVFAYFPTSVTSTNTTNVFKPANYDGRWERAFPALGGGGGGGETLWTNYTSGSSVVGNITSLLNPNSIISAVTNYQDEIWGDYSSIVSIGYPGIDVVAVASTNVSILSLGDNAFFGSSLSGCGDFVALSEYSMASSSFKDCFELLGLGQNAFGHSHWTNSTDCVGVGSSAFDSSTGLGGNHYIFAGIYSFQGATLTNVNRAFGANWTFQNANLTNCNNIGALGFRAGQAVAGSFTNVWFVGESATAPDGTSDVFILGPNMALSTGGDTNRWIFKSVTEGASTNIVVNINGKDYTFQAW